MFQKNCRLASAYGLALIALLWLAGCQAKTTATARPAATATAAPAPAASTPAKRIIYTVVWEHAIPNGGYTRSVFISPTNRNQADLKLLGSKLRQDTGQDRNAFVFVFDDEKAARMQQRAFDLTDEEGGYFDKHQIATYSRNINTGLDQLLIMVDGNAGSITKIDY